MKMQLSLILGFCIASMSEAAVVTWNASSGLTPDQAGFQLIDNSAGQNPSLNGGVLTFSTLGSETMYYGHSEPTASLLFPSVFEAAFNMRYVSGTEQYSYRTPATVVITTDIGIGTILFIGNDELFLGTDSGNKGPSVAVDTDGSFHDYLLRVEGSNVTVLQDSISVLSSTTTSSIQNNGSNKRVLFGDITTLESGTSEWTSFSHNAAAIPEPSTLAFIGVFGGGLVLIRRYFPSV